MYQNSRGRYNGYKEFLQGKEENIIYSEVQEVREHVVST
jgi:hypothetical protein